MYAGDNDAFHLLFCIFQRVSLLYRGANGAVEIRAADLCLCIHAVVSRMVGKIGFQDEMLRCASVLVFPVLDREVTGKAMTRARRGGSVPCRIICVRGGNLVSSLCFSVIFFENYNLVCSF